MKCSGAPSVCEPASPLPQQPFSFRDALSREVAQWRRARCVREAPRQRRARDAQLSRQALDRPTFAQARLQRCGCSQSKAAWAFVTGR
jgi:hypothetical protein